MMQKTYKTGVSKRNQTAHFCSYNYIEQTGCKKLGAHLM